VCAEAPGQGITDGLQRAVGLRRALAEPFEQTVTFAQQVIDGNWFLVSQGFPCRAILAKVLERKGYFLYFARASAIPRASIAGML
jgi:hypothetical protein